MIQAVIGVAWPLELQLGDGSNIKFPQAQVFASGAAVPLATMDMTLLVGGMYSATYTFAASGSYFVRYPVWTDAAHTIPDGTYDIVLDEVYAQVNDLDSLPNAILNAMVSALYSLKQYLVIIGSAVAGKASNAPTNTVFRDIDDTRDVITSVAAPSGDRTAAIYNP
jgi:hypothetical protein